MINDNYIAFSCIKYMIDNGIIKTNCFDLHNEFGKEYYEDINEFISFCRRSLTENFEIILSRENIDLYEHIPYFLFHYYFFKEHDIEELSIKIKNIIDSYEDSKTIDKYLLYALVYSIDRKYNETSDEMFVANFYMNNINLNKNIEVLENLILKIDEEFYDENIEWLISDNEELKIFFSLYNIEKVRDLTKINYVFKMLLCMYDINELFNDLSFYCKENRNNFFESMNNIFLKTTPRCEEVLRYRYGINKEKTYTLDEIGQIFSLTRERVRQIEKKGLKHIRLAILDRQPMLKVILKKLNYFKNGFVTKDALSEIINDREILDISIMSLTNYKDESEYAYDRVYKVLYDNEKGIDNYIEKVLSLYDYKINDEEYNNALNSHKLVIKKKYNKKGEYYILKTVSTNYLIDDAIEKLLNGKINFNDESQIIKVKEYLREEYNLEYDNRNLLAHLDRMNYISIGKGEYLKFEKSLMIPNSIKKLILAEVFNSNTNIYYSVLYEKFRIDLEKIGIDNKHYFKSLIDLELDQMPDEYNTTRDFIVKDKKYDGVQSVIEKEIENYDGTFNAIDVKESLSYIPEVTIINVLNTSDNVLKLDKKRYIWCGRVEILEEDIDALYKLIKDILDGSDFGVIGVKKIYSKVHYKMPDFFAKYKYIMNSFDLFTILKYIFDGKLVFNRPLVASNNNEKMNIHQTMTTFMDKFKSVKLDELREFLEKTGIRNHSILEILEGISDSAVLISKTTFVNKNVMEINELEIENTKKMLNLILLKENVIDIDTFRKYNILPRLRYEWNRYLLYGIIKTYLEDDYEIKLHSTFEKFQYTIRRKDYEK